LLVDLIDETPLPNEGVIGEVTLSNPLNAFYMSYEIDRSSGGVFDPADFVTDIWDSLELIPPGSTLTYNGAFSNTSQVVEVNASLLDTRAIVTTIIVGLLEQAPGLAAKSSHEIVSALGDITNIAIILNDEIVSVQGIIEDPLSWQTPQNLLEITNGVLEFLDSPDGQIIILDILNELEVSDPGSVISYLSRWSVVYQVCKYAVDAAIYLGISLYNGSYTNQILIVPSTYSQGMPPVAPRLLNPLGLNAPIQPTFQWNPVPRATSYNLQVDTNSNFSTPLINYWTNNTSYFLSEGLPANTRFYWRVFARNSYGNISQANVASFHTGAINYPPGPIPSADQAGFVLDVTLPDDTTVSPN